MSCARIVEDPPKKTRETNATEVGRCPSEKILKKK